MDDLKIQPKSSFSCEHSNEAKMREFRRRNEAKNFFLMNLNRYPKKISIVLSSNNEKLNPEEIRLIWSSIYQKSDVDKELFPKAEDLIGMLRMLKNSGEI